MKNDFYKFTAQKDEQKPARLDLFGAVGGGFFEQGFDEESFANAMACVGEKQPLDVYINSQGGSVFTALAIRSMLGRHKAPVTITVAGLAASAATIITCAQNAKVIMQKGSMMLIHPVKVDGGLMSSDELREAAENLDKVRDSVRTVYIEKTGLDAKKIDEMMSQESYLTAQEAVDLGFADEFDNKKCVKNEVKGDFVMVAGLQVSAALFQNAPADFLAKKEAVKMDLETLKKDYPELVEALKAEAKQEVEEAANKATQEAINAAMADAQAKERGRIQAIEEIAMSGHEALVARAKFEEPIMAEQLAVLMLKAEKAKKEEKLAAINRDAQVLEGVTGEGVIGYENTSNTKENLVNHLATVCAYNKGGTK